MSEWFWFRAMPSGHVHLFLPHPKGQTMNPLCGKHRAHWTGTFPPGARRCPRCFTMAGLPLTYEAEQRMLYGLRMLPPEPGTSSTDHPAPTARLPEGSA